ncbi:MAG: STAS domain-containing protein [Armatimonadota bacterium]
MELKMAITMSQTPEEVSVNVTGDLDLTTINAFQTNVEQAFELRGGRKLVVDLRKTDYIDSAGLEQLLIANRKLFADSDKLLVRVAHGRQPQTVLAVTGFSAVMDVESLDEA